MDPRQFAARRLAIIRNELAAASDPIAKRTVLERACRAFPLLPEFWLQLLELSNEKAVTWNHVIENQPHSAELWLAYLNSPEGSSFTCAEQAKECVGAYFLSGTIWKQVLERAPVHLRPEVLRQSVRAPIYEYAEFYQQANDAQVLPYEQLASMAETMGDLITKRWEFESQLKTQTFEASELSSEEVGVWHAYLDFAESLITSLDSEQFDPVRDCQQLYFKCLMITALYPEFWRRFLRFSQKYELPVRGVLMEAVKYHPKNRSLRVALGVEEETAGNLDTARSNFAYNLEDLVKFDLRNHIPPSIDPAYASLYEEIAGKPVTTGVAIDDLMKSWQNGSCKNASTLAEQLKAAGHLEEFFKVDATFS